MIHPLLCVILAATVVAKCVNGAYYLETIAGGGVGDDDWSSGDNSPATSSSISSTYSVWVQTNGDFLFTEAYSALVRKVDVATGIVVSIAGTPFTYSHDGVGGPAPSMKFDYTLSICADNSSNLYIASDEFIWFYQQSSGIVSRYAGKPSSTNSYDGDNGQATSATISSPHGLYLTSLGVLYFADSNNNRVRFIDTSGIINTFAGNGVFDFAGDNGPATSSSLRFPSGTWINSLGFVFIADFGNNRIRRVDNVGIITTFAGTGKRSPFADNTAATSGTLNRPFDMKGDSLGSLYISEFEGCRIRKVSALGIITTIAGQTSCVLPSLTLQSPVLATSMPLNSQYGLMLATNGDIYVANLHYIRRLYDNASATDTIAPTVSPSLRPSFTNETTDSSSSSSSNSQRLSDINIFYVTFFPALFVLIIVIIVVYIYMNGKAMQGKGLLVYLLINP